MATGYTADVCSGKQTEFADFAMTCARAFGALITMRDDPMDADVPEEFEPGTYNAKRLEEATTAASELRSMTAERAEKAASEAYETAIARHLEYEAEENASDARVEAMMERVSAWTPPTAEHVEMKKFMLEQLRISKRGSYRSAPPQKLSGPDWLDAERLKVECDIAYHAAEHAKEVERAKGRTEWVRALRASLAQAASERLT